MPLYSLKRWEEGAEAKYPVAFSFHYPLCCPLSPLMFLLDVSACFRGSQGVLGDTFPIRKQPLCRAVPTLLRAPRQPEEGRPAAKPQMLLCLAHLGGGHVTLLAA